MKRLKEGAAEIFVPEESLTKKSDTFYNPAMEHQRNVTVACVRLLGKKRVLDPLAATGIRGIRLIKEAGAEIVTFNDRNPKAVKLIEKNLKLNKITKKHHSIRGEDANSLFLEKGKFDYVDIDPFGSPARYLFNSGFALGNHSAFGVTATDSGALSGKFAGACFRRYGVFVDGTDFPKELGVRVLITSILRNLALHGLTFEPLYSHANHYFRVIGSVHYGAEKNLHEIRMVSYCPACHNKVVAVEKICGNCKGEMRIIGPLWTGKIQDADFCGKMLPDFGFGSAAGRREILMSSQEIDSPFYYDLHAIGRLNKKNTPRIGDLIENLKGQGFEASRTHLCLTGIKTNAGIKEILRLI
jgi:tRNA (guanine26-N2/guanine27-N2)-dimethyltransferase